jgi:hypothetical protein
VTVGPKRARGRTWTLERLDRSRQYVLAFDAVTRRWEALDENGVPVVTRDGAGPGAERTGVGASAAEATQSRAAAPAPEHRPGRHRLG